MPADERMTGAALWSGWPARCKKGSDGHAAD